MAAADITQTVDSVAVNNIKTFGHTQDHFNNILVSDALADARESRAFMRAVNARVVNALLGEDVRAAVADSVAANSGLDASQIGAKIAQTTPPETGVNQALAQIAATQALIVQLLQQQPAPAPTPAK